MIDELNIGREEMLKLLGKEQEANDYRKVLLMIQRDGTDLNVRREIDRVIERYGDSGLSMDEEY
ncbi:MAG: hypothetical protein ACQERX_06380 [Bacillota bacterium]